MTTSTAPSPRRRASVALAVIAVSLSSVLLSGCTSDGTADDAATSTAPADASPSTAAGTPAGTDVRATVGPLLLGVPDYWQVGESADGVTLVRAAGCSDGQACPTFAVLQGEAIAAGFDGSQAYTQDGTGCPNGLTPQAGKGQPQVTEIVIDGVDGTLSTFEVACASAEGEVQLSVPQTQWSLPDAPGGAVLVVDRWSFDGLGSRIAGAAWAAGEQ